MPSVGLRTAAAIAEMMQQRVAIECPRGEDDVTAPACETVRPIELESYQRKRWPVRTIVFSRKPSKRFPPTPVSSRTENDEPVWSGWWRGHAKAVDRQLSTWKKSKKKV